MWKLMFVLVAVGLGVVAGCDTSVEEDTCSCEDVADNADRIAVLEAGAGDSSDRVDELESEVEALSNALDEMSTSLDDLSASVEDLEAGVARQYLVDDPVTNEFFDSCGWTTFVEDAQCFLVAASRYCRDKEYSGGFLIEASQANDQIAVVCL